MIHSLLEWDPEKVFTWKEAPDSLIHKRNELRRLYNIFAHEKYGNPLTTYDTKPNLNILILPGKISDLKRGLLNNQSTSWWAQLQNDKSFLTNSPRTKITDAWASERLFYYVVDSVTAIDLQVKVYYTDGSDTTLTRENISSVARHDVYEIITSFSTLGIYFLDPTKTIEKYEVWIRDQSQNVISEVFTYKVDHTRHEDARYFLFSNGYKMIEGARFIGNSKSYSKIDQINLNRYLEKGYGVEDNSVVKAQPSEVEYREASSEWLSIEEITWLREILLSKEVYEIVNGETVPVVIDSESISIHEDNKNLRSITIRYRYAHADSVPAVLPEVEDSITQFQISLIDIGGLTNGVTGAEFDTIIYTNGTGAFTAITKVTDHPHAYSNNDLTLTNIPLLAYYYSLDQPLAFCDLEMLLLEMRNYDQASPVVPMIWDESSGFGILITTLSNFRFGIRGANGGAVNKHTGFIRLYLPTRRCLEFLYEKAL